MSDRPVDLDAERRAHAQAERDQRYRDGIDAWHAANPDISHLDPAAIAACGLCNTDGYRGTTICDHKDHAPVSRRGKAEIDEILASKRNG